LLNIKIDKYQPANSMQIACYGEACGECGFRSTIFNCLSNEQLDLLSESKKIIKAKKGEVVVRQGEEIQSFVFLRVGLAKLTRLTHDGKEQIVGIARPRDFVGLLSLFSSKEHQYSITTIEESEFCLVDYQRIFELTNVNGKLAHSLLEKISQVADILISTRLDLNSRQIRGRIAFILSYFATEVYNSQKFNLPISRKEIGELIDMRVENVVRVLSEFRKDGIIAIEGTQIEIKNLEKLSWISQHG
jgi:CRP/FNR family transcriptional regulator